MDNGRSTAPRWLELIRALRPTQWTKNGLVFAAFVFALGDREQVISLVDFWPVLWASIYFCLLSSSIYLLNDMRDIEQDRLHPTKRLRPLAAGTISQPVAIIAALVLAGIALTGAAQINGQLALVLGGYAIMQIAYTFGLKRVPLVDVFMIAIGFVLRAIAGAVAITVTISPWLLLCTFLLALFLALCKRRHEKVILEDVSAQTRASMQGYDGKLLDQLIAIVSAATIVSYALYTLWPDTVQKFGSNHLSFTLPFVMFGLFRYLDLVYRHAQGGHPEKILLTDIPLIVNLALYGLTVLGILYFG